MATALAAQLAQLAASKPASERYVRGKASLLFDYQAAADVSVEQIYNVAKTGLEALTKADKRFTPFADSLFSRASVSTSREQLTADENTALNANLAAFLRVLTNHFLSAAAFQVLEYCIRRYKVHVFNVDDLLLCALPYHATPEFARLLVILQLSGTPWEWLAPGQQTGAPPPRDVVVRRCVNDQAVLRVVCQGAQAVGVPGFVSKTYLSFYAVLLCEVLAALPRVTEDILTLLLPFLAAGLKGDASREYTSATLMVLTQLLARAQLSQDFLTVVATDVVRSWSDLGGPTVLMMLAHLAATQPHCSTLPLKALQVLSQEHAHVGQELSSLQARQANLEPLLQLLLPSLNQALPHNPGLEPLANTLLQHVRISPQLAQAAAVQLLTAAAAAAAGGAEQQHLQQVLRLFDVHYPEQLDTAINTALQEAAVAADATAAPAVDVSKVAKKGKGSKQQQKHQQQQPGSSSAAEALFSIVQQCFAGSRHELLAPNSSDNTQHPQQQQQALTLSLAVHAPASEMRAMALQKLDALCSAEDEAGGSDSTTDGAAAPTPTKQLLQSSLLSGLRDDVPAVAATAAAAKGLAQVPGEQQLPALQALLQRTAVVIAAGDTAAAAAAAPDTTPAAGAGADCGGAGGAKEAMKAAKAALAAVAAVGERAAASAAAGTDAAASAQQLQQEAAALLLEYVLCDKRCKRLSKAAVKVALDCSWNPMLQALATSPAVTAALEGAAAGAAAAGAAAAAAAAASQAEAGGDTALSPDGKRRKKGGKQAAAAAGGGTAAAAAVAEAGGKHSGALALNRAVVAALADAVVADRAADGSLLQQLGAMLPAAGPRCRQLLLLVLANAAAVAVVAAPAGGKAASKSAKQAKGSSSAAAAGDGSARSAAIAALLVKALEEQLAAVAAVADGGGSSSKQARSKQSAAVAAVLPDGWAEESAELLDAARLPTKHHLELLPKQLQHLNGVLLLSALHTALSAAPAAGLSRLLGQPVQLFARLAAATAGGASGLLQHLQLIMSKSGDAPEQQLEFLSSMYGLPEAISGQAVQVAALQLLPEALASSEAANQASSSSSKWFVRLLAAANSSTRAVRKAAVAALLSLPGSTSFASGGAMSAQHLQELLVALQQHQQLLKGSAGALQRLLCSAAAGAGAAAMDVDVGHADVGTSRARRGSKTGSAKSKAAASSQHDGDAADVVAVEGLKLTAEAAGALQQLLSHALPDLCEDADLQAAQLTTAVLAAGSDTASSAAAAQQLLTALLPRLCKHSTTTATAAAKGGVWQQLVVVSQGTAAVTAAASQLQQLRADVAASLLQFFVPEVLQQSAAVADSFVNLLQAPFSASAAAAVLGNDASDTTSSSSGGSSGAAGLSSAQLAALAAVRVAALQQFTPAAFDVLTPAQQQSAFTAALQTLASDGVAACRAAAKQSLEDLPVSANMLLVLLQQAAGCSASQPAAAADAPPTQSKAKRARKATTSSSPGSQQEHSAGLQAHASGVLQESSAAASGHVTAEALDAAVAALEFMQWRDDVADRQVLLQPLQSLLRLLVPLMGSIAESYQDDDEAAAAAAAADDLQAAFPSRAGAAGGAGGVSASAAGYAAQLVLLVLEQLLQQQLAAGTSGGCVAGVDVALVLSCASAAPDGAVRNAALLLMAALAQLAPEDVLEHVLKALAVIQHSAALQADAHSQAVASATLAALVPAWLAAGRGSEELWSSLLTALPGLPAHRRLGLLESLLDALPEDKGLPVGLLLMLQRLVELSTAKKAAASAAATPAGSKGKKGKKQPSQATPAPTAAATGADPAEDGQEVWLAELMASLCEKVAVQQRLAAFAAVLGSTLTDSQGRVAAYEPLPRLAVSFVAVNLKAKSVSSAISAARAAALAGDAAAQADLQQCCQAIITQALQHLLKINTAAAADQDHGKPARRKQKAINAGTDGVYGLLAALESVQDCPSYLLALVQMSKQPSESVRVKALKLLAARLSRAQIDVTDLEASTAQQPAAVRQAAQQELAEAGLAVCVELPRLLGDNSPAEVRQLALFAADAGIRLFGKLLHSVVLCSMLEVLKAVSDPSAAVKASALTCIASGVSALGMQLVPLLPKTAEAVLAAAEAAAQELSESQQQGAGKSSSSDSEEEDGDDNVSSDGSDDSQAQEGQQAFSMAALQLAGAVTAMEALVDNLGAFMSPYLPRLLQLLLHRQVLHCSVANANAVAGRLRSTLPVKVPSRLLLQPLLQQWDTAVAACAGGASGSSGNDLEDAGEPAAAAVDVDAAPAVALLDLVAAFSSSLQPSEAAAYHEQLAGLLLQALDTRSRWLAAAAGQHAVPTAAAAAAIDAGTAAAAAAAIAGLDAQQVYAIESAAVRALAALVMKLSESRFKPLFLRMLDWTNAAAAGDSQQQQSNGRVAALFAAVCAFSDRLRGVFAPYYKYFFTQLMDQLAGEGLLSSSGGGKRSKKKRKLSAAAAGGADAAAAAPGSDNALLTAWLARLRAVRSVHLLALHDGGHKTPAAKQEQQEWFDKLLPLLVEVLQDGPSAAVAAVLAVQGADSALDLPNSPVAALGAVGAAVVEAGCQAALKDCCDIVGTAAVGALVQMAVAGGDDVVCKPLHHAFLLATRGGSTRGKLLALGGVSRLAELLGQDYLNLLPEALNFVAELVEDGELAVQAAAQGLLAQMEALSGEKLDQYLKVS